MRVLAAMVVAVLPVLVACGDDDDVTVDDAASSTSSTSSTSVPQPAGGDTRPADVAVAIDGEPVPLERACQGADGAVVAVATTGRRIILVREEGLALRLGTEGGTFAETPDVDVEEVGETTVFSGTVLVEGQPTSVVIEVAASAELETCPELQDAPVGG